MLDKLSWITDELNALQAQGLRTTIRTIGSACGPWMTVDGKQVLNFCTNNYLGLANDPRLKAAAQKAIEDWASARRRCARLRARSTCTVNSSSAWRRSKASRMRYMSNRLLRQPGRHRADGGQGRRDLYRPAQPRQHH